MRSTMAALVTAALLAAAVAGCGAPPPGAGPEAAAAPLSATTPDPVGDAGPITWGVYRPTSTLDPIKAFDVPDNSVIDSLCEGLLSQQPDLSTTTGLAESAEYPDPRTLVLKLRSGVRFWDGTPLTTDDVLFSLQRARDPKAGGYYSTVFERVASIEATGPMEVTLKLTRPDYWLRGQLSTMAGVVVSKAYAERRNDAYGTPSGGVMCTGPFTLKSWTAGGDVVIERNAAYWDPSRRAKAAQITIKAVSGDAAVVAGLTAGDLDGMYHPSLPGYNQLRQSGELTVAAGPARTTDALAVTSLAGPLGDVRVRRALSLALDRQGYDNAVYSGQAALPRTSTNPGTWAYGTSVFAATSAAEQPLPHDLDEAKRLVREAGAEGRTVVMATAPALASIATLSTAVAEAARQIGLVVQLKTFSPDVYGTLFVDPRARAGIDLMGTLNGPNFGDPAPYLATYALPGGSQNYSGWENPTVTQLLASARETAADDERAKIVAEADKLITAELPWIPMAHPNSVLYMSKKVTGAPTSSVFENGPWAYLIGAARA